MGTPFTHAINSFNGGEISPHLAGRTDISKYNRSMKTIENCLVQPEGGVMKRPGTRFIKAIADQTAKVRLIPFIFSTEQAYVIEMGASYFKFYRDEGAVLESTKVITDVSSASPAVVTTSAAHGYSTGDEVFIAAVVGMTEVNGRFYNITVLTGTTFELDGEDSSGYTAYDSAGTSALVHTVAHTYTQAELSEVTYAQSADILYLAHKDHAPAKLSRTGHTNWTLGDITFNDGPYLNLNTTDTTFNLAPFGTGAGKTLTASAVTGINDGAGFLAADVGRLFRIEQGTSGSNKVGWGRITAIVSTTVATVTTEVAATTGTLVTWRLGSWYTANFPTAVSFAEGRLWWGGEPNTPSAIHSSKSADFENMAPSTIAINVVTDDDVIADDNGVTYTIGANRVNEVKWMEVGRNLVVGTPGGVYPVQASSSSEPITPTNVHVTSASSIGSASIRPVRVGEFIVFVELSQRRLRGLRFDLESDSFVAEDLTRIAEHISDSKLTRIDYQLNPDSIVWGVRTDGQLAALTFVPEEEIFAFARHILGGSFSTGAAVVEDIAIIPSPGGEDDQVYMLVKRTIDSGTKRYVEFLEQPFEDTDDIEDAYFLDCGLSRSGSPVTVLQGLNHLEGETVSILADAAVAADKTVSGGSITLDASASDIHVGYSYNANLETLKLEIAQAGDAGTTMGITKRIHHAILRFDDTIGAQIGRDSSNLDAILWRAPGDPMDAPPPRFTGDKRVMIDLGHDRDAQIFIRQDLPLPFHLLSMTLQGEIGER